MKTPVRATTIDYKFSSYKPQSNFRSKETALDVTEAISERFHQDFKKEFLKKTVDDCEVISRKANAMTKKLEKFIKKSTRSQHKKVEALED